MTVVGSRRARAFVGAIVLTSVSILGPSRAGAMKSVSALISRVESADLIVVGRLDSITRNEYLLRHYDEGGPSDTDARGHYIQGWWDVGLVSVSEIVHNKGWPMRLKKREDGTSDLRLRVGFRGYEQDPMNPEIVSRWAEALTPRVGMEGVWLLTRNDVIGGLYRPLEDDPPLPPGQIDLVRRCIDVIEHGYAGVEPGLPVDADTWAIRGPAVHIDFLSDVAAASGGGTVLVGVSSAGAGARGERGEVHGSGAMVAVKLDRRGKVQWATRHGGSASIRWERVAMDREDRVTLVGNFLGTMPTPGDTIRATQPGRIFVTRLSRAGEVQWVQTLGGEVGEVCAVAPCADGGVFVAGTYTKSVGCRDRYVYACEGASDVFLARLDADGNPKWLRKIGGPGGEQCDRMVVCEDGGVVLAGKVEDAATANEAHSWERRCDAWIQRCSASGDPMWTVAEGMEWRDQARDVAVGQDGSVAALLDIQPGETRSAETHLYKWHTDGSLAWSRPLSMSSVAIADNGDVVCGGSYYDFESDATLGPAVGEVDLCVARVSGADGSILYSWHDGGVGQVRLLRLLLSPNGRALLTGVYLGKSFICGQTLTPTRRDGTPFIANTCLE